MNLGGTAAKHAEWASGERFLSTSHRNSDAKARKPNIGLNFLAKVPEWLVLQQQSKLRIPSTYFKLLTRVLASKSKTRRLSRSFY